MIESQLGQDQSIHCFLKNFTSASARKVRLVMNLGLEISTPVFPTLGFQQHDLRKSRYVNFVKSAMSDGSVPWKALLAVFKRQIVIVRH